MPRSPEKVLLVDTAMVDRSVESSISIIIKREGESVSITDVPNDCQTTDVVAETESTRGERGCTFGYPHFFDPVFYV